jgi:hypothetical protein
MGLTCPLHEFHLSGFTIVDQNEMDGHHLIVTCTLYDQENMIKSHTLIDYGATRFTFLDKGKACHHHLPLHYLKLPRNFTVIDGRPVTLGAISHITYTCLAIQNYQDDILLFVPKLGNFPIILGIP